MKTYKREVALGFIALWVGLTGCYLYFGSEAYWVVAQTLLPYVMVFAGGAFGLDAIAKQVRK